MTAQAQAKSPPSPPKSKEKIVVKFGSERLRDALIHPLGKPIMYSAVETCREHGGDVVYVHDHGMYAKFVVYRSGKLVAVLSVPAPYELTLIYP